MASSTTAPTPATPPPPPQSSSSRMRDNMLSARHGILSPAQQLAKEYRTEIAASASSCVSTFVAVSRFTAVCPPSVVELC